jgi:hypothetical protein
VLLVKAFQLYTWSDLLSPFFNGLLLLLAVQAFLCLLQNLVWIFSTASRGARAYQTIGSKKSVKMLGI